MEASFHIELILAERKLGALSSVSLVTKVEEVKRRAKKIKQNAWEELQRFISIFAWEEGEKEKERRREGEKERRREREKEKREVR